MNRSNKSKSLAVILCVLLGVFGVHRFYVGKTKSGILYLCTFGLFGIGWIYDIFNIVNNLFTDSYGAVITDENPNQTNVNKVPKKPAHLMWQFWVAVIVFFIIVFSPSNASKNQQTTVDSDTKNIENTIDVSSTNSSTALESETKSESKIESKVEPESESKSEISTIKEFEVEIGVTGHRKGNGVVFNIATNLPDTAELLLTLSNGDYNDNTSTTAQAKVTVKDGKAISEPFSNGDSPLNGNFDLCVSMSLPSLQTKEVREVIGENGENMRGDLVEKTTTGGSNVVKALFLVSIIDEIVIKDETDYSYTTFRSSDTTSSELTSENNSTHSTNEERDNVSHNKYEVSATPTINQYIFIINTETNKVHKPTCAKGQEVLPEHRFELTVTATSEYEAAEYVRSQGYDPCGICMK